MLHAAEIFEALETQHPGADTELRFRTPFELLAATILSAQSTDARVNQVDAPLDGITQAGTYAVAQIAG